MYLSIFLPAYNEEKILEENTVKIFNEAKKLKKSFEIFVIDDGSKNKELNEKVGKNLMNKYEEIKFLRYDNGPSRRENLGKSFKLAKGKIILFSDIDLPTGVKTIIDIIKKIEKGFDIAIASRYVGKRAKRKFPRKITSILYNKWIQFYFGSKIRDHQCGLKAFKKDVIFDLMKDVGYDKSFKRGWFWDAELLIRAQKKNYKIIEFPTFWEYRGDSSFNLRRELRMIGYVFKLRWGL